MRYHISSAYLLVNSVKVTSQEVTPGQVKGGHWTDSPVRFKRARYPPPQMTCKCLHFHYTSNKCEIELQGTHFIDLTQKYKDIRW